MQNHTSFGALVKKLAGLLERRQRVGFAVILVILAVSALLSQVTPLAVGYLTDQVLAAQTVNFAAVLPILVGILVVNVVNEVVKVLRRLIVEDTATRVEKTARQKAAASLLQAPLSYFRAHMTGNIHGRLNRSLEGTVKLIKLVFMDFAPAVATGIAAIGIIFLQLPALVALGIIMVIPIGTAIVLRQIATQRGIRVTLMEKKPRWTAPWWSSWAVLRPSAASTALKRRATELPPAQRNCAPRRCAITEPWPNTTV